MSKIIQISGFSVEGHIAALTDDGRVLFRHITDDEWKFVESELFIKPAKPKSKELVVKKEELDFSVLGFTDIQCTELIRIRKKNKGGALTQRVIDALAREFRLGSGNGYHIDDMLTEWEVRGWKSFKAEWMKSKSKPNDQYQRNIKSLQEWTPR